MTSIRTEAVESCLLCGGAGRPKYAGLRDHVFGAPGSWSLSCCERCGLLWLNPRPVPDDIVRVYATYYTHGEATQGGAVFARYFSGRTARLRHAAMRHLELARATVVRRRLEYGAPEPAPPSLLVRGLARVPSLRDGATLAYADLPASARGRLLDVGCGNGDFLLRMREVGWSVTGVEPDPSAAEFASTQHGIDVRVGQLEDAAFPDGQFDAIVLSHVIEHVYDPVATLRECRRVLAPGGRIVALTPNARSLGHRLLGRNWRGLEPPRHLHVFDPATLATCARLGGLQVTSLRTSARLMRGIWYVSRSMKRGDAGDAPTNARVDYIESYLMAALEDAYRIARPRAGEELVLTATRSPDGEER